MSPRGRHAGEPLRRKEDPRFLTGEARFVADLPCAGFLHVEFLRSAHAHARIRSVEAGAARRMPGVAGVFTLEDLRGFSGPLPQPPPGIEGLRAVERGCLAGAEAVHAGQGIAAIVAESRRAARDALHAIHVDYEPLPAVVDPEKALAPDSPRAHSALADNVAFRWETRGGDVDAAFRQAAKTVRLRFVLPRVIAAPLETRGVIASFAPGRDLLTVQTSTESPQAVRHGLAAALGMAEGAIRVVAPDVGGGFGSKLACSPEEVALGALARIFAPRPLRWLEDRSEAMLAGPHGRGQVGEAAVAVRDDGRLLGVRYEAVADLGAHVEVLAPSVTALTGLMITGAYHIPTAHVAITGVYTNKAPASACRGAGRAEAALIIERLMDRAAAELELDPIELRRRNFPRGFPFVTATGLTYDSGDYGAALDRLLEASGHARLREERDARRRRGELVGIGVSTYVEMSGMGPSRSMPGSGWEAATVTVGPQGKVEVITALPSRGKGEETSHAQIAADEIGVSPEDVRVEGGDTARVLHGSGAFGSRTVSVCGAAVHLAARQAARKMREIAAFLLKVPPEYVEQVRDRFFAGEKSVSSADVCFHAYRAAALPEGISPGISESACFEPESFTFPFGAHLSMVSIDRETGEPRLERHVAVDDAGRIVNPLIAEGQIHGGIVQGLGHALLEEAVYDDEGQLLTEGFLEYAIPRASGVPPLICTRTETPSEANPLGAKGIGDAGVVGSLPAIVNAVVDALRELGVGHIDPPLTPEKIWRLIRPGGGHDPDAP